MGDMGKNLNNLVTRDVTIVHFLLMFGYKLFSAYFPLFLAIRGFSLPQVGWSYLLIYLPIALGAPFAGFLCHKTNPVLLMILGIFGYAGYALAMVYTGNLTLFYFWQIILGISAALFFTSSRFLLMSHPAKNVERGFSWFYNAPVWADIAAPAAGAILLRQTNFSVIFLVCFAIQVSAIAYSLKLWRVPAPVMAGFGVKDWADNWRTLFAKLASRRVASHAILSFALLWQAGLYSAFFVLFLKNELFWNNDRILFFVSLSAAVFSLAYFAFIRPLQKDKNESSIFRGTLVASFASLFFALPLKFLSFFNVFAIDFVQNAGAFLTNAGRSAMFTKEFKNIPAGAGLAAEAGRRQASLAAEAGRPKASLAPEAGRRQASLAAEAGGLDTMFSPLGTALGSLTAGFLIGPLGYQGLFFWGGVVVIVLALVLRPFEIAKQGKM